MSREMEGLEESIEVSAPVRAVYDQWTQFEDFPRFMQGVESVTQVDDEHLHWIAEVGGRRKEWDAHITRQVPDGEIDWVGLGDPDNRGRLVFEDVSGIDGPRTKLTLMLDYETEGPVEKIGDALGLVRRRVQEDLVRFKEFIEARGSETDGWRGAIHVGKADDPTVADS
ncbi:MAG: SRPBCC family protein [Actinomycetota bacterium]